MIPVTFGSCRGWLNLPADAQRCKAGVVFFSAYGVEDLSTRHSLSRLAQRLAQVGHPVLRFDAPGTGDALGDWQDPQQLTAWVQAGQEAVKALQEWSGVTSVALLGLRLGGLIAAQVAHVQSQGGLPVAALALLAPVIQGRQFVREWRALSDGTQPLVVAGFPLSQETQDALSASDMSGLPAPAPRIFLGVHGGGKAMSALQTRWGVSAEVLSVDYEGLAEHIGNPTTSRTPHMLFDRLVEWLGRGDLTAVVATGVEIPPAVLNGPSFIESGLLIPSAVDLAAVWCRPVQMEVAKPVVIFCNAGRNPLQGWARGAVTMARQLAAQGISSLRFDLAGLGDSPPLPQPPREVLYSPLATPQLRAAVDQVCSLVGKDAKIGVLGVCSGGYLAFHGAVEDARIGAVVLINVQRFAWREGMSLQAAMREAGRSTQAYRQRLWSRETWVRLVRGQVDVAAVVRALRGRWSQVLGANSGDVVRIRRAFSLLAQRGCRIAVVYSEEDGGRDEFARYFGSDKQRFGALAHTSLRVLPGADHDLSASHARDQVIDVVKSLYGVV